MKLNESQRDTLIEIINIGAGRAGKQLSALLADTIEMHVPNVQLVSYEELPSLLQIEEREEVVCIRQQAAGSISGQVMLMFHSEESRHLVQALIAPLPLGPDIDVRSFEHEAMTEIGNIVISACIGGMADFMGGAIGLRMPHYAEGTFAAVLAESVRGTPSAAALVIHSTLRASRRAISGTLLITFTVDDLKALLDGIDAFLAHLSA